MRELQACGTAMVHGAGGCADGVADLVLIHLAICLPGLAWLSAIVVRVVQPNAIADRLVLTFLDRPAVRASSPGSMPSLEHR